MTPHRVSRLRKMQMENGDKVARWLVVGGAAVAALGSFLPWIEVRSAFGSLSQSGLSGPSDGWAILAMALAVGIAGATIWHRPMRLGAAVAATACALAASGVATRDGVEVALRIRDAGEGIDPTFGPGLVLCLIAAPTMLAGGISAMCMWIGRWHWRRHAVVDLREASPAATEVMSRP